MDETLESIQNYLNKVFIAVDSGKYRILPTEKNNSLEYNYLLTGDKRKEIIKSLQPIDFSEILISNDKYNKGYRLYVFGKQAVLKSIFDFNDETVDLYIKIDQDNTQCLIVVSFHKQEKPISYYFK